MPISPERRRQAYANSITFATFVDTAAQFAAELDANYKATKITLQERRALKRINDPIEVLAIVEDRRPDVLASLPILARIADETGRICLHVLVPDESTGDVADAYTTDGRSRIPTYVFSDSSGRELGVIVERIPQVRERVTEFLDAFVAGHPELDRETFPAGLTPDLQAELTQSSIQLRRAMRDLERSSFIAAITEFASLSSARSRSNTRYGHVAASIAV